MKIAIFIGIILQINSIIMAYAERGRFAVGGEWFVLPLILIAYIVLESAYSLIKETYIEYAELSASEKRKTIKGVVTEVLGAMLLFITVFLFMTLSVLVSI